MLEVKVPVSDERALFKASTPEEFANLVRRFRDLVSEAHARKSLGLTKAGKPRAEGAPRVCNWMEAADAARAVLGRNLQMPILCAPKWTKKISARLESLGYRAEDVTALAEYAKAHLSPNREVSFDFLICQAPSILAGKYDVARDKVVQAQFVGLAESTSFGPALTSD